MSVILSENFTLREFTVVEPQKLLPLQWYLIQHMAEQILEPLRAFACKQFNKDIAFRITSGMRANSDRARLLAAGYNPSERTDHDYGRTVRLTKKEDVAKFGEYYSFSVGAVDVVPDCGAREFFDRCKPYFNHVQTSIDLPGAQPVKIRQFILEKGKGYWIHVSNPPELLYREPILKLLKKDCFLQSLDNGKSYQKT